MTHMSFNKELSISCFGNDIRRHQSDYKVQHLVTWRKQDTLATILEV